MRKFKKKVQEANLIQEIRERKEFVKSANVGVRQKPQVELGGLKKEAKRLREFGY